MIPLLTASGSESAKTILPPFPPNSKQTLLIVSAAFFVGDGSGLVNVPSAEGGTLKVIKPGTGLAATVNGASATTITVSGTLNVNPNQSFGTVSVSTGLVVPQGAITFSVPVSGTSAVFTGNVSAANVYAGTNVFVGGTAVPTACIDSICYRTKYCSCSNDTTITQDLILQKEMDYGI